jgi:hypothetical protein
VFQPVGLFTTRQDAFTKAKDIVSNTAAASFKVMSQGRRVDPEEPLGFQFRPSKREKGVFVEKRRFRISTPGEKAEIRPKKGLFGGRRR